MIAELEQKSIAGIVRVRYYDPMNRPKLVLKVGHMVVEFVRVDARVEIDQAENVVAA